MRKLPYGIEATPPTARALIRAILPVLGAALLLGALLSLGRAWLGDGPPPTERPSDTFYGLSEGE